MSKEKNTFNEAKEAYTQARRIERAKLRRHLNKNGFRVEHGKSGAGNYKGGGALNKECDLSDWLWLDVLDPQDEASYLISLQSFDRDVRSGNRHTLADRIGVYKYRTAQGYSAEDAFRHMEVSDWDLPLNEGEMQALTAWMLGLPFIEHDTEQSS